MLLNGCRAAACMAEEEQGKNRGRAGIEDVREKFPAPDAAGNVQCEARQTVRSVSLSAVQGFVNRYCGD
ncbi:MAG: hypothetical protein SOH95_03425 [Bifidobacterium crudilactis]